MARAHPGVSYFLALALSALHLASCGTFGDEWPPPEKEYAWVPYVESISVPEEIFAHRSFQVTVRLSTEARPELLDEEHYQWMARRRSPVLGQAGPRTIEIIRAARTGYNYGYFPYFEVGDQPGELLFTFTIDQPGEHTIRVVGTSARANGGLQAAIFRGYNMGGEYWYFTDEMPAGTGYRNVAATVLEPEFDDLYYYGYLPYVEEFTAPRQLLTNETVPVLVRLSTSIGGDGSTDLSDLMDPARQKFMLCFHGERPPEGEYAGVLWFDGTAVGKSFMRVYTTESRELGGRELVFLKYPTQEEGWLQAGQSGYRLRELEFEVLGRTECLYGDRYEVRVPYVEEAIFPERMVEGKPDVIRVKLAAELPGVAGERGYFLHRESHGGGGDLVASAVYEPHQDGLVTDEMLIIYDYLPPGEHTLRVHSVPTPEQGGMTAEIMFGEPLSTVLPAGLIQREFSFTVESAE